MEDLDFSVHKWKMFPKTTLIQAQSTNCTKPRSLSTVFKWAKPPMVWVTPANVIKMLLFSQHGDSNERVPSAALVSCQSNSQPRALCRNHICSNDTRLGWLGVESYGQLWSLERGKRKGLEWLCTCETMCCYYNAQHQPAFAPGKPGVL